MIVASRFLNAGSEPILNYPIGYVLLASAACIPLTVVIVKKFVATKRRRMMKKQREEYARQKMLAIEKLAHDCKLKVYLLLRQLVFFVCFTYNP